MHKLILLFIIIFTLTITGCQAGEKPEETIYSHLELAVQLESGFEEQQNKMVQLETQEKDLYDQIINLGLKEAEKIKQLAIEAITIVDERKNGLTREYESMQQAEQEFENAIKFVAEIENEELKTEANSLVELMSSRYSIYDELYEAYSTSVGLDKELYLMLQKEGITLTELEAQIKKINNSYEKVIELNETFNQVTSKYNEQKKSFYVQAGLNVSSEVNND